MASDGVSLDSAFSPWAEAADRAKKHAKLILVDDFELALQGIAREQTQFAQGEIASTESTSEVWASVRVVQRHRVGQAVGWIAGPVHLEALIDRAVAEAQRGLPNPWFRFPLWKQAIDIPLGPEGDLDRTPSEHPNWDFPWEERREKKRVWTNLSRKSQRFSLKQSFEYHRSAWSALVPVDGRYVVHREERTALGTPVDSKVFHPFSQRVEKSKKARKSSPAAPSHLLWGPKVLVSLLENLSPAFCGRPENLVPCPNRARLGAPVSHREFNLTDEALSPHSSRAVAFDLEGSLSQETRLIENGIFKSQLHNNYTAIHGNRLSTGSFHRNVESPYAEVLPSYFSVSRGTTGINALIRDVRQGFYLDEVEKIMVEAPAMGRARVRSSGWLVQSGEMVAPVHGVTFDISLWELLERVVAVGREVDCYAAGSAPAVLMEAKGIQTR